MNDEVHMNAALAQAKQAKTAGELPFGAVVVCDGKVIAQNRCRESHEKTVAAHAELQAVNDACRALKTTDLKDCTIYCTNEPCLMCASAIFQANVKRIVIGALRDDFPDILRPRKLRIEDLASDLS
ncbi:MAG: nucleoside deaminase, partial [Gammaproteobacteria bacterium]|nr:nucleoside deaminase [Gammaproteobacteria bacterium]